jgi:signal transduction histidine kinase
MNGASGCDPQICRAHYLFMRSVWANRTVVGVCTLIQVSGLAPGAATDPGWLGGVASLAGLAGGLGLWWRWRAPLAVVSGATACYVLQAAIIGPVVPAAVLLASYSVARYASPVRGALAGLLAVLFVALAVVAVGSAELAPTYAVPLMLAVLVGVLVSSRQARAAATTRAAVLDERLRIARDLHDVVGHGMGAITVQAGAGRMALDAGVDEEVRRALVAIEQCGRGVLREVRWLVGVLRDRPDEPKVADLATLAEAARSAGIFVELSIDASAEAAPPATGEALYRIVQESLTNVLRHSGASRAEVRVHGGSAIILTVLDNGGGTAAADGNGIRGMRERASAMGGALSAGPRLDEPGWQIEARLPITGPTMLGRSWPRTPSESERGQQ